MPELISVAPLREQIADIVREMIINAQFQAGQKISERQIGDMLDVSTTPVKEAFRILQAEGLIYSVPRKGSYVASYSQKSVKQIIYLRSAMDGVAAYFAAENATEEELETMTRALAVSEREILKKGNPEIINENNNLFHDMVRTACHNEIITNTSVMVRNIDVAARRVNISAGYEEMADRHREHKTILKYIKEHKPKEAERAMIEHVRIGNIVVR